jgi:hypothetical protein
MARRVSAREYSVRRAFVAVAISGVGCLKARDEAGVGCVQMNISGEI